MVSEPFRHSLLTAQITMLHLAAEAMVLVRIISFKAARRSLFRLPATMVQ